MNHKFIIVLLCFLSFLEVLASPPPCQLWQFKVRAHPVSDYIKKDGTQVISYKQDTYCKEKWRGADFWGHKFKTKEGYKKWVAEEIKNVLALLADLPQFFKYLPLEIFLRGDKSKISGNPASSIPVNKEIILYDDFFKSKNRSDILIHEFAHIFFSQDKKKWGNSIFQCSGWELGKFELKQKVILLIPPKKVILEDSKIGLEEDFANHFEKYFSSPKKYKGKYPECYKMMKEIIRYE